MVKSKNRFEELFAKIRGRPSPYRERVRNLAQIIVSQGIELAPRKEYSDSDPRNFYLWPS